MRACSKFSQNIKLTKITGAYFFLIFNVLIENKTTALAAADRKRSFYPVDYRKNKKLKTRSVTEMVDLLSDDEPAAEFSARNMDLVQSPEEVNKERYYYLYYYCEFRI